MITPVLINLFTNIYKWKTTNFDKEKEKWFTWIFVVLCCWPQYQVIKLLYLMVTKKHENHWKKLQDGIKKELSYMEPFMEAIPQFFISTSIFGYLTMKSNEIHAGYITSAFFRSTWAKNGSEIDKKRYNCCLDMVFYVLKCMKCITLVWIV